MNWNISFKLQPGEELVEKADDGKGFGLQAMYTPVLTNRRALFKFNSLNTNLVQSFSYDEITSARQVARLLVKYLKLTVDGRDVLLNVDDPEGWAGKIMECRERYGGKGAEPAKSRPRSLSELLGMLETLKEYGLLSAEEFEDKRRKITG